MYYLSDRQVGVHQGFGNTAMQKDITTNTFNYDLNWSYEERKINNDFQPRAWSQATIWVGGMENVGGVVLTLDVPYAVIGSSY